jgi:hypothetical protein
MEIEIIEAGALVSLPGGHEDRQRILRILHGIYSKCRFDVLCGGLAGSAVRPGRSQAPDEHVLGPDQFRRVRLGDGSGKAHSEAAKSSVKAVAGPGCNAGRSTLGGSMIAVCRWCRFSFALPF